jgi:uncharacterized protein YlxW (UPF0749 family)
VTVPDTNHNFSVSRHRLGLALVALVALATGFVLADQVRTQLLTPSNQVARYQALVRSVQDLEARNADGRRQIAGLRAQIESLESGAAARSATTQALKNQVADLRGHAGLVAVHGPGVEVVLRNGAPGSTAAGQTRYLVNFQDVQDVVNLLFAEGAEAIAVNGERLTSTTTIRTAGSTILVDFKPIGSPYQILAIGPGDLDKRFNASDTGARFRRYATDFGMGVTVRKRSDITLAAAPDPRLRFARPVPTGSPAPSPTRSAQGGH